MRPAENILNWRVSSMNAKECISKMAGWIDSGRHGRYFVCANPHSLEVAGIDPDFSRALHEADIVIPDGIGIVIASKILGGSIKQRVTGMDIFIGLSSVMNNREGCRYFFLGSSEQNLYEIRKRLSVDFPKITIAGTYAPPYRDEFDDEDCRRMIEAVNSSGADILWVGMTAPKQEKWIFHNRDKLNVKFIGPIGAVFDFYSGAVRRSSPFFQQMGLEWLPRLLREPRRLWRRNLISNPSFIGRVLLSRLNGNRVNL